MLGQRCDLPGSLAVPTAVWAELGGSSASAPAVPIVSSVPSGVVRPLISGVGGPRFRATRSGKKHALRCYHCRVVHLSTAAFVLISHGLRGVVKRTGVKTAKEGGVQRAPGSRDAYFGGFRV